MTNNPILNEIYAARDKLLDDVDGDVERLLAGIRERELKSGRQFVQGQNPATSNPLAGIADSSITNESSSQAPK